MLRRAARISSSAGIVLLGMLGVIVGAVWLRSYWTTDWTGFWWRGNYVVALTDRGVLNLRVCRDYPFSFYSHDAQPHFIGSYSRLPAGMGDWKMMIVGGTSIDWRGLGGRVIRRPADSAGNIDTTWIVLPLAYPTLIPPALVVLWISQSPTRLARKRAAAGLCPGCGYDLRASSGACPECGRDIAI
jgi:hypothetical protein